MNYDQVGTSVQIPEELKAQAAALQAGEKPRATVRELLEWFEAERRGFNVVRRIRWAHLTVANGAEPAILNVHGLSA